MGRMFLILVDAHSKWMEVKPVSSATSAVTIEQLRSIFATHGLPEMLVSDNGSVFTSEEFKAFTKNNGIRHVTSAPYHPASNGLAERAVQTFKESMKKFSDGSISTRVSRFLFAYRNTPHTTTGSSPAELLFSRRPRTRLDLIRPSVEAHVVKKQYNQKQSHDKSAKSRSFKVQDTVYIRNFGDGESWLPGTVTKILGPFSFVIELVDGRSVRRHIDHVMPRSSTQASSTSEPTSGADWLPNLDAPDSTPESGTAEDNSTPTPVVETQSVRRSTRVSVPPTRYDPSST